MAIMELSDYEEIVVKNIAGRYVSSDDIMFFLKEVNGLCKVENIGKSVQQRPINSIEIGNGPCRILMWSQMHGNESTTTKAILDLLNHFRKNRNITNKIIENCTIKIIPILNPDGACAYTRVNANNVDLNRDAKHLSQPESQILRNTFDSFKPHFAFNLHGQRTIYNVGVTNKSATISFLSPSVDDSRKLTDSRRKAMKLIVAMNQSLQKIIPGSVGRYDDGFNINCVGDTFQSLGCPTVLFEAGHFPDDYEREEVRKLIFISLLTAIRVINNSEVNTFDFEDYFDIPENGKQFFDILIKNIDYYDSKFEKEYAVGILFEEVLNGGKIDFIPKIEKTGILDSYFGHQTYDCSVEKDLLDIQGRPDIRSIINNI